MCAGGSAVLTPRPRPASSCMRCRSARRRRPERRRLRQAFDSFTDARRMSDSRSPMTSGAASIDISSTSTPHQGQPAGHHGVGGRRRSVELSRLCRHDGAPFHRLCPGRSLPRAARPATVFSENWCICRLLPVNDPRPRHRETDAVAQACGCPETASCFCAFGNAPKIHAGNLRDLDAPARAHVRAASCGLLADNRATANLKAPARRGSSASRRPPGVSRRAVPRRASIWRATAAPTVPRYLPYKPTPRPDALWTGLRC